MFFSVRLSINDQSGNTAKNFEELGYENLTNVDL